jgi:hypothetical protein
VTSIWDLKRAPFSEEPRYYPPGQHPATWRMREHLRCIEAVGMGDSDAATYIRDKLVAFEEAESEAKARDHLMPRGRA